MEDTQHIQIIARIKKELYSVVAPGIRSEIVVLTEKQKEHIIKRRGQAFYCQYACCFSEIAENPDYIFRDERHPNTAIACKTMNVDGSHVHLVIRLAVAEDEAHYENSVITALIENDKRYMQRLRNKIPLYKRA